MNGEQINECMKKIEIEIPEGKKNEWVNGVLTLVDDKPKNVMERIKTFEDAISELGDGHKLVQAYNAWKKFGINKQEDIDAYLKLRIIASALNEGWNPEFTKGENRWYLWFEPTKDGGVEYTGSVIALSYADTYVGSRLALKNEELAEYCGTQFIDIWKDYILGNYEKEE